MRKKEYRLCKFDQKESPPVIIDNPNVIDVYNGTVNKVESVVLKDGRIVFIGNGYEDKDNAKHVDAEGKYLMPGLWDMHTHIADTAALSFPLYLANGVTGIRDMGSDITSLLTWDAYPKPMPRIVYTGPIIDGYSAIPLTRLYVTEPKDVDIQISSVLHYGASEVKVHNNFPREAYFELAKQCKERGEVFVGHVPIEITVNEAIEAGQKTIEHMVGIHRAITADPDGLRQRMIDEHISGWDTLLFDKWAFEDLDQNRFDKLVEDIKENGVYVSFTLSAYEKNLGKFDLDNPWRKFYPAQHREEMEQFNIDRLQNPDISTIVENLRQLITTNKKLAKMLYEAGVPILVGTDALWVPYHYEMSTYYGDSLHRELEIMVDEVGISAPKTIRLATAGAAEYLEVDDIMGSVDTGKVADLILLQENPLEKIQNSRTIEGVFLNGQYFDKQALIDMQIPQ